MPVPVLLGELVPDVEGVDVTTGVPVEVSVPVRVPEGVTGGPVELNCTLPRLTVPPTAPATAAHRRTHSDALLSAPGPNGV